MKEPRKQTEPKIGFCLAINNDPRWHLRLGGYATACGILRMHRTTQRQRPKSGQVCGDCLKIINDPKSPVTGMMAAAFRALCKTTPGELLGMGLDEAGVAKVARARLMSIAGQWKKYVDAGEPNGHTDGGFRRWLVDQKPDIQEKAKPDLNIPGISRHKKGGK